MLHPFLFGVMLSSIGFATASPISKRLQPGDELEQTFTLKLMSRHCDPAKATISLNSYDEHDDSTDVQAKGQTFTGLSDYRNADGTQVKPSHGYCQFGEMPFTEIPTEPRQFTVTLTEDGHAQRSMEVSGVHSVSHATPVPIANPRLTTSIPGLIS